MNGKQVMCLQDQHVQCEIDLVWIIYLFTSSGRCSLKEYYIAR